MAKQVWTPEEITVLLEKDKKGGCLAPEEDL